MITLLDSTLVGSAPAPAATGPEPILVLAVGNVLMGDEGVGVHVMRHLEQQPAPPRVRLLDGGTGGINLLTELEGARSVILIEATRDGRPAGSITYLQPREIGELPRGLSAHDFGLKDLFATAALLGSFPDIHLSTVSVEELKPMCMELSPAVSSAVPEVVHTVHAHAARLAAPV